MRDQVEASLVACATATEVGSGQADAEFSFAADLPVFAGHFPGRPIVPGVFLIEMARTTAERVRQEPLRIHSVRSVRFTAAALPDTTISVHVELLPDATQAPPGLLDCQATATVAGQPAMKLRMRLVPSPHPS